MVMHHFSFPYGSEKGLIHTEKHQGLAQPNSGKAEKPARHCKALHLSNPSHIHNKRGIKGLKIPDWRLEIKALMESGSFLSHTLGPCTAPTRQP